MAIHGVAGYMAGCRCEQCFSAQREREQQIAAASTARWSLAERRTDRAASGQSVSGAELAQEQSQRQRRMTAERQRMLVVEQVRRRYEQAVTDGDFRWLLAAERRALNSVRARISRLIGRSSRPQEYRELLWRQAQQMRELTERHHRELLAHMNALGTG